MTDPRPLRAPADPPAAASDPVAAQRLRAAQQRARADSERDALVQSIVDYVERERSTTHRLVEQSALVELAPDPIFVRNAERRITFWNAAAEAVYGFTAKQAVGRVAGDLLRTEYPIPLEEIERIVEASGLWEGDLVQTTSDGRQLTVASRWGALFDEDGHLNALLEVNRDVTERLEAQAEGERLRTRRERERMSERLVRAQRLESLGQMAGGIAHDFNNLLAVIMGYASVGQRHLAKLGDGGDPAVVASLSEDLAQIAEASERAAALTRQLLDFARQDAVQAGVIDVNAAIREMLGLLQRTLGSHIEITAHLASDLAPVRIDAGQLSQILLNLAVNSRDAMPEGGRLTIETSRAEFRQRQPVSHGVVEPGSYLRLRVSDTGGGMTREVVEHAFDPFYTTKPVGLGTGLGLATVYGIVSRAGGQVELYSEIGLGTTVTLVLPLSGESPAARPDEGAAPEVVAGAEILVVEDEASLRRVLASQLTDAGYRVTEADSGTAALALAEEPGRRIDLLLTDAVMPGMLGQQLAQRVLATRPDCPVVFMSGFAHPVAADATNLPGPLLQKPFSDTELLAMIAERLGDPERNI